MLLNPIYCRTVLIDSEWQCSAWHAQRPLPGRTIPASGRAKEILVIRNTVLLKQAAQPIGTGPRSAVGNVSGYRCVSDCRSRGREFDPGPVPYFRGDWSWNNFYGHSPPFLLIHSRRVVVSYKRKYVHKLLVNRLFKPAKEKVWLGELTVPQWP